MFCFDDRPVGSSEIRGRVVGVHFSPYKPWADFTLDDGGVVGKVPLFWDSLPVERTFLVHSQSKTIRGTDVYLRRSYLYDPSRVKVTGIRSRDCDV